MTTSNKKTSLILKNIIAECNTPGTISVGEFLTMLGDRAFYLAILIFSLPNSLPIPGIPGVSTVTGLPITFIAFQLMLGRDVIWLPVKIAEKSFNKETLAKLLSKTLPGVIWLEKFLRPRWPAMTGVRAERTIGAVFVVLSLIIALPIPGGNFLPGVAMSLIALAMLEKDGAMLSGALIFAAGSVFVMIGVIKMFFGAVIKGVHALL